MKRDLTIIILAYNSEKIIKDCLTRLNFNKYNIILIDNASKDNTVKIAEEFSKLTIIKNHINSGYSRANNIALKIIKTDFALILNVDAIISDKNIEIIINAMKENCNVAIAGPKVFACNLQDNQITNEKKVTKIKEKIGTIIKSPIKQDKDFYYSQFVTGAGMFLNMKIMRKIGFFDEGFFLYCEDNEICKRVLRKGYQCAISKNSKFHHIGGASSEISHQECQKIHWHKLGWSRAYYSEIMWGKIIGKIRALGICFKLLPIYLCEVFFKNQKDSINKAGLKGAFSYLIGLKAFDKNGQARGQLTQ